MSKAWRGWVVLVGLAVGLAGCGAAGPGAATPTALPPTAGAGLAVSPTLPAPTVAATEVATMAAAENSPTPLPNGVIVGTSVAGGPVVGPPLTSIPPVVGGPPPVLTPDASGTVTITGRGGDARVELGVSQVIQFSLDAGYDWTARVDQPAVLAGSEIAGGAGTFTARGPGQTLLSVVGDPVCRKNPRPCEAPSFVFTLTVVVH